MATTIENGRNAAEAAKGTNETAQKVGAVAQAAEEPQKLVDQFVNQISPPIRMADSAAKEPLCERS